MYPRVEYEMTQEELDEIIDACKPTRVMFLSGGVPLGGSPQENANAAWARLGEKRGFDSMSVRPVDGKGMRFFTAIPTETAEQKKDREAREAEEARLAEISTLEAEIAERNERLAALRGD